jgi:DNA-binding IclR family transcriptional regulator
MSKSRSQQPRPESPLIARSSIKSLDAALSVLTKLATFDRPASLSEISISTGLPTSKVHRYLMGFMNVGLVTKRHRSGRYDLGKAAVELGLAAMTRTDIVNRAAERLEDITERTHAAALLAVWGTQGPVIVRWQRNPTVIIASLGLGTSMPLLNSASGRIFLGFAEESVIEAQLDRELKQAKALNLQWPDLKPTRAAVRDLRDTIRANGYATDALLISGHYSVAVPVLNWQQEVEAAITVVSMDPRLIDPRSPELHYLLRVARDVSIVAPQGGVNMPTESIPKRTQEPSPA